MLSLKSLLADDVPFGDDDPFAILIFFLSTRDSAGLEAQLDVVVNLTFRSRPRESFIGFECRRHVILLTPRRHWHGSLSGSDRGLPSGEGCIVTLTQHEPHLDDLACHLFTRPSQLPWVSRCNRSLHIGIRDRWIAGQRNRSIRLQITDLIEEFVDASLSFRSGKILIPSECDMLNVDYLSDGGWITRDLKGRRAGRELSADREFSREGIEHRRILVLQLEAGEEVDCFVGGHCGVFTFLDLAGRNDGNDVTLQAGIHLDRLNRIVVDVDREIERGLLAKHQRIGASRRQHENEQTSEAASETVRHAQICAPVWR
ncbi:MAG: hypothetical protein L0219_22060 [Phycisphaerales bacterium]|nr:hypothetical protein [Phycisphaerales bacterium]